MKGMWMRRRRNWPLWLWIGLVFVAFSAQRANAAPIEWDLQLTLTYAGTEPVAGLFVENEQWLARIVWDAQAPKTVPYSGSFQSYADVYISADLSRPGKEIHFDIGSAEFNGASVMGQPNWRSDIVTMTADNAVTHGSSGGQSFTAPYSDIMLQLEDPNGIALNDLKLPIDPRPVSQFLYRGLSLELPDAVGGRSTAFLINDLTVTAVPEPSTGLLLMLGLSTLAGRLALKAS
jgi:hypothetical protein